MFAPLRIEGVRLDERRVSPEFGYDGSHLCDAESEPVRVEFARYVRVVSRAEDTYGRGQRTRTRRRLTQLAPAREAVR